MKSTTVVRASLLLIALGCVHDEGNEAMEANAKQSSIAHADSAVDISKFLADIRALDGQFTTLVGYGWTLPGAQERFAQAGSLEDSVVDSLVACLGDETSSGVTLEGEPVPVAILCYEALKRTAVVPSVEDSDEPWVGALRPNSSTAEIRDAHEAWVAVIAEKRVRRM